MNSPTYSFSELFEQLGLPASDEEIRQFLAQHHPLPTEVLLPNAPFWSPAQATFLREELLKDADWAIAIDHLNVSLRPKLD